MVLDARGVFLQVERDSCEKLLMPRDDNRHLLANIHIETSQDSNINFAEKLASCGFNPFILHHGHRLKKAINEKKGIFNLPEEVFTYPFRM